VKIYEFNFIWVGDKPMPQAHLDNIANLYALHPQAIINLWTMPNLLHPKMREFLRAYADIVEHDIRNMVDPITCPKTYEIVELLKQSTLWSALGDILKLLILTRPVNASAPHKRFYMEADNVYPINLEALVTGKGFVFHDETGSIRCDSLYRRTVDDWFMDQARFTYAFRTNIGR